LPYELLLAQPEAFLERLGGFVGVSPTRPEHQWVNPSPSALSLSLKRHANRWIVRDSLNPAPPFEIEEANRGLKFVCYRLDAILPAALKARHERRWRRAAERAVGNRYAGSNTLTTELTGLDLKGFGYPCE
jgi:hypothetical protein